MAELAGSIASVVRAVLEPGKCLAAPIGRQFMYLYNYNTNFKNLEKEVTKLKNTRDEVQVKVTAAERNLEEIKQNVKDWQKDVDSIIDEAEKLIQEKGNNPRCFKGLCPNLITRYKHSKKAFKLKENDISQLLDKEFNEVSYPTNPPEIWLRSNKDYLAFGSRTSTEKNIWDALNDENIYMIGVYGMGGLGKTTLVQELGREAEKNKLFEDIVFVEVTETLDTKKVQTSIANKLGLKFEDEREDERERANKLYSRMKNRNILLIVDNIWEELNLMTVGIPSEDDRGRSKILITTRNVDVLEKIGSTNNFGMSILNEKEAWSLFKKMAGNVIQACELNSLPNDVCKECGGLPIVICAIAKALRNRRQESQWEDALRELRMPSPTKFTRLLEKEYSKIKLSYDYLEDELKKTFIISSLMGNDTSISDLFKSIVSLGILEGANLTIEQARNRLDLVVKELKDSCLLLDGSTRGRFSMHDVIRIVAITCGYTYHHVFTERNDIESEWKDKDKRRKCTIISLVDNNIITQLWPEELDCPKLEFFNISKISLFFEMPKGFFTMMPKLKVLKLFGLEQSLLSLSIDLLTNLQTLCLEYSYIKDVAIIGKLKKLKVLSLRDLGIEELPTEIGQLTELKFLDLRSCRSLKDVAPNVISKLSQLEALYIKGCAIWWKVEIVEEFKHLNQLTTLKLDIRNNIVLPQGFLPKELKRYKILIGDWPIDGNFFSSYPSRNMINVHEFKRVLKVINSTISSEDLQRIKNVEFLWLIELSEVENGLIKSLMRPLFEEQVIFPDLKVLALVDINSRKIWDNQLPTSSCQNLTHFLLMNSGNIKYVFPSIIAKSLKQLQHIEICDCEDLMEIVAKEEGIEATINFVFPQVTFLKLQNLPKLKTFYLEKHTSEWPKLKKLMVKNCDKFMRFILEPKSLSLNQKINSDLEELELRNKLRWITWQSHSKTLEITDDNSTNIPLGLLLRFENLEVLQLHWCRYKEIFASGKGERHMQITLRPPSTSFKNLKVLYVISCSGLINLMTPSTARSLLQLREMSILYCGMVIEIVENEVEGDATTSSEIVFNKLKKLSLIMLESLTCFCSGNYSFNFPSLEELIVGECPNMKAFSQGILNTPKLHKIVYERKTKDLESGGSELNTIIQQEHRKKVNSNLKKMTLTLSGRGIQSIWQGEFQENFGKVKTLQLIKDEYANIPIQILQKFKSLEELILKVSSYEEIFSSGEDEERIGALTKLKVLQLWGLFNLKCISKQDSRLNSTLLNLHSLEVNHCHNLMTLLSSSTSFENLTTLTVSYCNGMQNLMSSSAAKILVRLEYLSIQRCEMIIEVLANEEDIEKGEIVFENLKELCLYNLERLICFCSGNYTLKFPFLKNLRVKNCFKMKTFSRGGLSMPTLQTLNDEDCSESDIDTIIQQLQNDFSEFLGFIDEEDQEF